MGEWSQVSRAGDGVRFKLPVPGGPNATIGGCRTNVYDPRRVSKMDASAVGSVKSAPVSDIVTEAQVRETPFLFPL